MPRTGDELAAMRPALLRYAMLRLRNREQAVERSLRRLPANAARVFVLREVLGLDTDEVCEQLAISASSCWVTLHRARRRLQACPDIRGLAADAL